MLEALKILRALFIISMALFIMLTATFMVYFVKQVDGAALATLIASAGIGVAAGGRNAVNELIGTYLVAVNETQKKE